MKVSFRNLTYAAMVAALYVLLTFFSSLFGLHNGVIQFRLSETLAFLPLLFPGAIVGLTIGCLLSNLLFGGVLLDIIFGTIATVIGAIGTHLLRKKPYLSLFSPVLSNMFIIPFVLKYGYQLGESFWFFVVTIGLGQLIMNVFFGGLLYRLFQKRLWNFIK